MNVLYDEQKQTLTEEIRKNVLETTDLSEYSDDELYSLVEKNVKQRLFDSGLSIKARVDITDEIFSAIRGFGIIDIIMKDEKITEIMINGKDNIFIEKDGVISRLEKKFESEEKLYDLIQRIVSSAGREVNQANPIVDTRLPDGSRVNVVLPPLSLCGPSVTIRKFSSVPLTMKKLISMGSVSEEAAKKLKILVEAGYNIFISGGTGSGKTTFLNALSGFIPKNERIITIEDSAELMIEDAENLIRLETRNANSSGTGMITVRDLIRNSLRMRPDRIIVGEVRGAEALDMLQAMNTGHDGSLSTGHANSAQDMISRLETMVMLGAENLPAQAVRRQIASAVDIIIHLSRMRDHSRKVTEISEVTETENGDIRLVKLYEFEEGAESAGENVTGMLKRTENKMQNTFKLERCRITEMI